MIHDNGIDNVGAFSVVVGDVFCLLTSFPPLFFLIFAMFRNFLLFLLKECYIVQIYYCDTYFLYALYM